MIEEITGGEDVAPGDFAAVSNDHPDDALIFQAGSGLRKGALHFVHEVIDGDANGLRDVNFFVGFRASVTGDSGLETVRGYLGVRSRSRRLQVGAVAYGFPDFGLGLIHCGAFSDTRMDDGIRGGKLRGAGPAPVLDAEDIERQRRRADGNDAVLANDAGLFAT